MAGYEVAIKPSARRLNRVAGEWVGRRGHTRTFAEKSDARAWAEDISAAGKVRIQDVAPNDPADVDGYLVADPNRNRRSREPAEVAALDVD